MICPKCGCENSNNNVYCSKCGNKLRGTGGNSKSLGIAFLPLAGVLAGLLVIGGVFLLVQSHAGQETVPQETGEPGVVTGEPLNSVPRDDNDKQVYDNTSDVYYNPEYTYPSEEATSGATGE